LKKSIDKNYKKMTLFKLIQRGYLWDLEKELNQQ
jgi:hypothetical protein